ncbi:hypothetical protein [uncultured Clostridium sp.]|uniref:hypothetical protein n=1 Tax=uncultured Clostridium sp. TaxID=59620 RepID=UPI00261EA056|nr:hypothetical protein [uncultured Clostridium sp.]
MVVIDNDLIAEVMISKLCRRDIYLIDHKTNEKIAIDDELNNSIKDYYERKVIEHGNKEVM